jgi:thiol-disulfide isomerase/thioredoxin
MRLGLLLVLLLFSACSFSKNAEELVGSQLPQTRFIKVDGQVVSSTDYLGKPTVLVFWGEWCSHCRKSMPRFNRLASTPEYVGRVNFLAVSISEEYEFEKFSNFVNEQKLHYLEHFFSGVYTADEAYVAWRGEDVPHYYVINREGVLVLQTHSLSDVESLLRKQLLR